MLFSEKHKFIFIANPKTGTTAIQSFILKNLDGVLKNRIPAQISATRIITGKDNHIKSKDLKRILRDKIDDYRLFTFIRDPYAKAVSAYFFYKNGKPINYSVNFANAVSRAFSPRTITRYYFFAKLNIFIARITPFAIWSLILPLKTNRDFLLDENHNILINYVGRIDHLSSDLSQILRKLNIELENVNLDKINVSTHKKSIRDYYSNRVHKFLFKMRYRREIELYDYICSFPIGVDLRDKKINKHY